MPNLVLGVDGGGTKTVAWLALETATNEDAVIGRGVSGPSNMQVLGLPQATRRVVEAVEAAFQAAGMERCPVAAACCALAGAGREDDRRQLEQWSRDYQLAEHTMFVHDALPILAAGTPDGWGIALIAGTGSLAYGRSRDGQEARSGGWGYLMGDEGSGYAIARAGLQAVVQAADGRAAQTQLLDRFLSHFQLTDAQQLIPTIYQQHADRAAIAALAELVLETAATGDAAAESVIQHAAEDLAAMVAAIARRLQLHAEEFPLALAGGVLIHSQLMQSRLLETLAAGQLAAGPITPVSEPVSGAVRLARQASSARLK